MGETVKYTLDESRLPDAWYNLAADLPAAAAAAAAPGHAASRSGPTTWRRSSRWR